MLLIRNTLEYIEDTSIWENFWRFFLGCCLFKLISFIESSFANHLRRCVFIVQRFSIIANSEKGNLEKCRRSEVPCLVKVQQNA